MENDGAAAGLVDLDKTTVTLEPEKSSTGGLYVPGKDRMVYVAPERKSRFGLDTLAIAKRGESQLVGAFKVPKERTISIAATAEDEDKSESSIVVDDSEHGGHAGTRRHANRRYRESTSESSHAETEKFLCELLLDTTQSISERFRALFSLRNLKGPAPRTALILATRDSSNLLAHEAAFALGQMQELDAIPALASVLNDLSLHPIVRHEAAEALGAIGSDSNLPLLKKSLDSDPAQEVRETCELALQRIQHLTHDAIDTKDLSTPDISPFKSVDPAAPATSGSSVNQLREVLLDEEKGMYERYAALFALRNDGGNEAVAAIIDSLGSKSALLKHEVAYVLGQLQDKAASAALSNILRDVNEHPMVRHEAAEALGSIADDQSVALLEEFTADPESLVSESCQVALSMLEFERSGKSFEFLFMRTPIVH